MNVASGSRRYRLLAVPFAAVLLLIGTGAVSAGGFAPPPDKVVGSHGHYAFDDTSSNPGVQCQYAFNDAIHKLNALVVTRPKVWWPDRNAANHHEHGQVGWRATLQQAASDSGPWSTVAKTGIQKGIAYEGTRAPFTNKTIAVPTAASTASFRVIITMFWYHPDGSTMGSVKHWPYYYELAALGSPDVGSCPDTF